MPRNVSWLNVKSIIRSGSLRNNAEGDNSEDKVVEDTIIKDYKKMKIKQSMMSSIVWQEQVYQLTPVHNN